MHPRLYVVIQTLLIVPNAILLYQNLQKGKTGIGQMLVILLLCVFIAFGTNWKRFWHG